MVTGRVDRRRRSARRWASGGPAPGRCTASTTAARCSGVVPQQPPTMPMPRSATWWGWNSASSARRQVVVGAAVDDAGQAGVGQHADRHRAVLREVAEVLLHLGRPGGAVDAEHVGLHGQQRRQRGADLGADQHPTRRLDRHLHLQRAPGRPGGLHGPAAGDHRRLGLQQVHAGLDDEQVDAALEQPPRLLLVGVAQLGEADVTERRQLGARADRAGHVAGRPSGAAARRPPPGDAGRGHVERVGLVGDPVLGEHGAERAEGGRLDHVDADGEEVVVHRGDDVGPGEARASRCSPRARGRRSRPRSRSRPWMYVPKAPSKTTTRSLTASRNGWSGIRATLRAELARSWHGWVAGARRRVPGADGCRPGSGGSVACRMARERIYTRTGDDGTTGLFYGGRVRKDSEHPAAYGTVDEVQAVLGLARAAGAAGGELAELLDRPRAGPLGAHGRAGHRCPQNRRKLTPGSTAVTAEMVERWSAPSTSSAALRPAHRVRGARRDRGRGLARPGPDRRPPGRAARASVAAAAVARRRLPEPAVRPAVDHGPLAGGRVPPPGRRRSRSEPPDPPEPHRPRRPVASRDP